MRGWARSSYGASILLWASSVTLFMACGENSSPSAEDAGSSSGGESGQPTAKPGGATSSGVSGSTASASGRENQGGAAGAPKTMGSAGKNGSAGANAAGSSGTASGGGGNGSAGASSSGQSSAAAVARKLGRPANFLIGMGNDLPEDYDWENAGIFTLPHALDIHYYYLTYGWQDWNPGGDFPIMLGAIDKEKGVTPMVTYYGMTGLGEANLEVLTNQEYMEQYWDNLILLFDRYKKDLDAPAIVHLEPDFWAFAQIESGGDASALPARLHSECEGLPDNLSGVGRCIMKLARSHAPKVLIGFHASAWGGDGDEVGGFLKSIGGSEADLVVIDVLDRDAGCFEAGELEQCQRGGEFYWDETNRTSPNFHEHLAWARDVSTTLGVPILWWQIPFGVPSDIPGGTPGHYRDNRVKYLFEHVNEFVEAGGVGACFGVGAGDQTDITTDGGQFANAATKYYSAPVALP